MFMAEESKQEARYSAFFLDKENANTDIWEGPLCGPYEYESIGSHGNEWFDLFMDGYELWIHDITLSGDRMVPDLVLRDIKDDFADDGIKIKLKHKYHGKWLIVQVVDIKDG